MFPGCVGTRVRTKSRPSEQGGSEQYRRGMAHSWRRIHGEKLDLVYPQETTKHTRVLFASPQCTVLPNAYDRRMQND